ncbi:MAG: hypothetical protein AB2A00_10885 [Myxococcota bacterium]
MHRAVRMLALVTLLLISAEARTATNEFVVGRGFDVGLWGTGLNTFPDVTNPRERAFDSIIRSPTTQGIGRIFYRRNGILGRPLSLWLDFNTYKMGIFLRANELVGTGLSTTVFVRGEWMLTGLFVHHMKNGDNLRERGFIGYYGLAGARTAYKIMGPLSAEVELSGRQWFFHNGLRTARGFALPANFSALEPRFRLKLVDIQYEQRNLGLPRGLGAVVELGADVRLGSRSWGHVKGEPPDPRNQGGDHRLPRRVNARGTFGTPLPGRLWLTLQSEVGYGLDEDDVTRTRIGGMNPFSVNLPGAAWGEYWSERFGAVHGELGILATPFLYAGFSAHGVVLNDPRREGDLDRYDFKRGVTAESRIGMGRLGFLRFRVGGSPDVIRKKGVGSLAFLFWWELGNTPDRFL